MIEERFNLWLRAAAMLHKREAGKEIQESNAGECNTRVRRRPR